LQYAAGLVFAETIQHITNLELLYSYILHRLYNFEFCHKPQVYEKNSIFIPTGFDSLTLINELCKDGFSDQMYNDVIKKPPEANQQAK